MALSEDGELTPGELINKDGFLGVNGLFRFRDDGTAERSLAIMETFARAALLVFWDRVTQMTLVAAFAQNQLTMQFNNIPFGDRRDEAPACVTMNWAGPR